MRTLEEQEGGVEIEGAFRRAYADNFWLILGAEHVAVMVACLSRRHQRWRGNCGSQLLRPQ
jgi:hypothetical protein